MADYGLTGGGESVLIYAVKADHTDVVQADLTTDATTNAHALIELTTGIITPTFNTDSFQLEVVKNDGTLATFLKTYSASISAGEVDGQVVNAEAGTKWDVDADAGATATNLLMIYTGALSQETNKRFAFAGLCTLDPASLNYTTSYKQWATRTLVFTPVQAKVALSIVNGLLKTGKYGASATMTIAQNAIWEQAFLTTV